MGRLEIWEFVGKKRILGRCHPIVAKIRQHKVSRSCEAVYCVKGCLLFVGGVFDLSTMLRIKERLSSSVPWSGVCMIILLLLRWIIHNSEQWMIWCYTTGRSAHPESLCDLKRHSRQWLRSNDWSPTRCLSPGILWISLSVHVPHPFTVHAHRERSDGGCVSVVSMSVVSIILTIG